MTQTSEPLFTDGWSPRRVELLREHHALGLSASDSAELLGCVSRNAVVCKRKRLGLLAPRPKVCILGALSPARQPIGPYRMPPLRCEPLPEMDVAPPPNANPKHLCERLAGECAWPLGPADEEGDYRTLFCCAPTKRKGSYCGVHAAMAHQPE